MLEGLVMKVRIDIAKEILKFNRDFYDYQINLILE